MPATRCPQGGGTRSAVTEVLAPLTLLMRNSKGVAWPSLGGDCGRLGGSCGRPELPRQGRRRIRGSRRWIVGFCLSSCPTHSGVCGRRDRRVADPSGRPVPRPRSAASSYRGCAWRGRGPRGAKSPAGQTAALPGVQDEQTLLWRQGRRRRGGLGDQSSAAAGRPQPGQFLRGRPPRGSLRCGVGFGQWRQAARWWQRRGVVRRGGREPSGSSLARNRAA